MLKLLRKFKELFDEKLSTWKTDPLDFELKENVKPIFSGKYPLPNVHEEMFKKDIEHLVLLGVLELSNDSEWGDQSFVQPEPKSNLVHFLSDFLYLNKQLKHKPYPIPKTNEMLLKLEVFQYATSLDLNMVYYHIQLIENTINLCRIIIPWVNIVINVYQWELQIT